MTDRGGAGLSAWHLTMMALGTVIGGSFFLGSAIAIRAAGPAILIAFILGGFLVYIVLSALSEMTVTDPATGSFRAHAEQMYGPAVGFVTGWVYWTGLTLAMSSEATAAALFLLAWIPGISLPVMAGIIVIAITLVNMVGAKTLSNLESGLAFIKIFAVAAFIVIAILVIGGLWPGKPQIGIGALAGEPLVPAGLSGIAGSMLIVMFTYAGFEVIGLAAPEVKNPHRTVPRAILMTILGLVGLYCLSIAVLLPLISTASLSETTSPLVAGLTRAGLSWVAGTINVVMITAILSTMLAAMFGMGRMIRSLADEGYAPLWLKEEHEVPRRGILFSGAGMMAGVALSLILPRFIYLFLVSSGGFALLFTYVIILSTHYKFRRIHGCPPRGKCQLWGYPYTTVLGVISLAGIIFSMPLIPGQGSGLLAGLLLLLLFTLAYVIFKSKLVTKVKQSGNGLKGLAPAADFESAEELQPAEAPAQPKKIT